MGVDDLRTLRLFDDGLLHHLRVDDPAKYWDPDSEPFFANVTSALPYLAQPLTYIKADDVGPAAVALLDMIGYGTSAALSTILYWSPPQAAKAGT